MSTAYLDALKMLSRRELSEMQVRQRLARREHPPDEIDAAVERLKAERAVDDTRVAELIARVETGLKRHGRLRVQRQIESVGIARATATNAVDNIFDALDADTLIEAALAKRLRGRERALDQRELQRLYRYLIGQGFEPDRVSRVLRNRRPATDADSETDS